MNSEILQIEPRQLANHARRLAGLSGVLAVTADPIRGQLVVKYSEELIDRTRLRKILRPDNDLAAQVPERFLRLTPWLSRLPRLIVGML
ncbi:MAG: hypothetical protein JWN04_221 [Myxococcaceae bacterium]|nr:hypothetical protein [Myxococcaceae bacterium]